jgi:glycosyltransferase involved in cell wall biosynthesis
VLVLRVSDVLLDSTIAQGLMRKYVGMIPATSSPVRRAQSAARYNLPRHNLITQHRAQGMMKGEELSQAYASGDVFLMPSESETLGFVVLEAMASRVPVVCVAAGGLTDIVTRPGSNGARRAPRRPCIAVCLAWRSPASLWGLRMRTCFTFLDILVSHSALYQLHCSEQGGQNAASARAGLLYLPGDYVSAIEQIRRLITDKEHAEHVAQGGRSEVERWGWGAATRTLRARQYGRAIRHKLRYKRWGWAWYRSVAMRTLRLPFVLLAALCAALIRFLDYAQPVRAQTV